MVLVEIPNRRRKKDKKKFTPPSLYRVLAQVEEHNDVIDQMMEDNESRDKDILASLDGVNKIADIINDVDKRLKKIEKILKIKK